jgi:hypothetical protein
MPRRGGLFAVVVFVVVILSLTRLSLNMVSHLTRASVFRKSYRIRGRTTPTSSSNMRCYLRGAGRRTKTQRQAEA